MIVREQNKDYIIRDLKSENDDIKEVALHWRFKLGTYFLIVVSNAVKNISLHDINSKLNEEGINDSRFFNNQSNKIYESPEKEDGLKVFFLKAVVFEKNHSIWRLHKQELAARMPYKISIYACERDEETGELIVYESSETDTNKYYIPLSLGYRVNVKAAGLINRRFYAELLIEKPDMYSDGSIVYRIRNKNIVIPLPYTALGRRMYISLEENVPPIVDVIDEAKGIYNVYERKS